MQPEMTSVMSHSQSPKASIPSLLNMPSYPPRLPLPSLVSEAQRSQGFSPPNGLSTRLPAPHVLPPMQPGYNYVPQLRASSMSSVSSVSGPHISPTHEHYRTYPEYAPSAGQEFAYVQLSSEIPNGAQIVARPTYIVSSALSMPAGGPPVPQAHYPLYRQVPTSVHQQPQYQHPQQAISQHQQQQQHQQQAVNPKKHRRFRRRYYQIVRRYKCTFDGCTKRYGSLNHLNTHIVTKKHGTRKSKADFKDLIDSDTENKEEKHDDEAKSRPITPPISTTESKTPEASEIANTNTETESNVVARKTPEAASMPTPSVPKALPKISDILDAPVKLPSLPSIVGFSP